MIDGSIIILQIGGSKGGGGAWMLAPLSISCSFHEKLAKPCVGALPPGELAPPPQGNDGSVSKIQQMFPILGSCSVITNE